jgi:hypothetical protein
MSLDGVRRGLAGRVGLVLLQEFFERAEIQPGLLEDGRQEFRDFALIRRRFLPARWDQTGIWATRLLGRGEYLLDLGNVDVGHACLHERRRLVLCRDGSGSGKPQSPKMPAYRPGPKSNRSCGCIPRLYSHSLISMHYNTLFLTKKMRLPPAIPVTHAVKNLGY